MSHQTDLAERASLSLIAAKFFLNLALNPRTTPTRPTAILTLMPFLSAFLYESIRYAKQENSEALQELRSHQGLLRALRMRKKLLDGDLKTLKSMLGDADELVAIVEDLFMRDHRAILGPLAGWL